MKKLILILSLIFSLSAFSQAPDLSLGTQAVLEAAIEDFAGNVVHSTATGAHSATVFGLEVGILASTIEAPALEAQSTGVNELGNAGFYAKVEGPLGLGAEVIYTPLESDSIDYDYTSFAVHYSTSGILDWKFKLFSSSSTLSFVDGGTNVSLENTSAGGTVLVGKKLVFVEPYAGVGYVTGTGKIIGDQTQVFGGNATTFSLGAAGIDADSTYAIVGVDMDLLFMGIGLEYSNPFGNSRVMGRVAIGF